MVPCILCHSPHTSRFHQSTIYTYYRCSECGLVFADPEQRLSPGEEKSRYDLHQNSPDDPGYRKFLSQLFDPLSDLLPPSGFGLDYGSGPGPTLSVMFKEAGYTMNIFDPFYANHPSVLNRTYDFITTTETAEHFYRPADEFRTLWKILKPGGHLGIMTLLLPDPEQFSEWSYITDDTHVTFYGKKTFHWLAKKFDAGVSFYGDRVIILHKPDPYHADTCFHPN